MVHPSAADYHRQHQLLDGYLMGDGRAQSVQDLRRYFHEDGPASQLFTGRRFDRVAGRGDGFGVEDEITAGDLLALTFLSVHRGLPELTLAILEVHAKRITELLAQIPVNLAMHEADWAHFAPASPADELWELLRTCAGKNRWVTAHKLLARKRPHLLPIYDRQVREVLGRPRSVWACIWTWFHEDVARVVALEDLRTEIGGIADVSLLRCLDVVLWMRGRSQHDAVSNTTND